MAINPTNPPLDPYYLMMMQQQLLVQQQMQAMGLIPGAAGQAGEAMPPVDQTAGMPSMPAPTPGQTGSSYAPSTQPTAAPVSGNDENAQLKKACDTLMGKFTKLGSIGLYGNATIDADGLRKAANGENGPEMKEAAQFLLSHPEAYKRLETMGKASPDGKISVKDVQLMLRDLGREEAVGKLKADPRLSEFESSLNVVKKNLSTLDSPFPFGMDGKFDAKDLDRVIADSRRSEELRKAARFLKDNPDLFAVLDTGANGGKDDGKVASVDVEAVISHIGRLRSSMPSIAPMTAGAY